MIVIADREKSIHCVLADHYVIEVNNSRYK